MATNIIPTTQPRAAGRTVLARIGTGFAVVISFLCTLATARRSIHELERLTALSDDELARLGLRRDEIVQYVFRNHMQE